MASPASVVILLNSRSESWLSCCGVFGWSGLSPGLPLPPEIRALHAGPEYGGAVHHAAQRVADGVNRAAACIALDQVDPGRLQRDRDIAFAQIGFLEA